MIKERKREHRSAECAKTRRDAERQTNHDDVCESVGRWVVCSLAKIELIVSGAGGGGKKEDGRTGEPAKTQKVTDALRPGLVGCMVNAEGSGDRVWVVQEVDTVPAKQGLSLIAPGRSRKGARARIRRPPVDRGLGHSTLISPCGPFYVATCLETD